MRFALIICAFLFLSTPAHAQSEDEFSFTFKWGDIPLCTSGKPNVVDNPFFIFENIPENTKLLRFKLVDENVPKYKHGGGEIKFRGLPLIKPGQFTYKSPCPPDGPHTYTWKVFALDAKRRILGTATNTVRYPE